MDRLGLVGQSEAAFEGLGCQSKGQWGRVS